MAPLFSWTSVARRPTHIDGRKYMAKTAILVDGGFYKRVATKLWGKKDALDRAEELYQYAVLHITGKRDAKIELEKRELYRIFYYDCPPVSGASAYHPLKGKNVNFQLRMMHIFGIQPFRKPLAKRERSRFDLASE